MPKGWENEKTEFEPDIKQSIKFDHTKECFRSFKCLFASSLFHLNL